MFAVPMSSALHGSCNAAAADPSQQGLVNSWDHCTKQPQEAGLLGSGYSPRHSRGTGRCQALEAQQVAARLDASLVTAAIDTMSTTAYNSYVLHVHSLL